MTSVPVVVLALAGFVAVTWGFSPIMEKRGMSNGGSPVQASLIFVLVSVLLYWVSLLLLRGAAAVEGITLYSVVVFGVAGFVGTALGRISVFEGVGRVGPSVNGAGISTRPVFSAILAWVWLGEGLSALQVVGISTLVSGLVLVSVSDGGDVSGWEYTDLFFPVFGASLFGSGFVVRRFGLIETSVTPLQAVAINETVALVPLAVFFFVSGGHRESADEGSYLYFLAGGVCTAAGLLAFFVALSMPEGRVAVVDPIAAAAPVFTVVFSYIFLDDLERVTARLVVGLVLTTVGAALVGV